MRYLLIFAFLLILIACSTPQSTATTPETTAPAAAPSETYAGMWDVTVSDTPMGTVNGELSLQEGANGLEGSFTAGGQSTDLRSVGRTDDGLLIMFYSSEYQTDVDIRLKGEPGDDTLEGTALRTYKTVATRK